MRIPHASIPAILIFSFCCIPLAQTAAATDDRSMERHAMVSEQIAARGVKDPFTLKALRQVPRHLFVPAAQSRYAYADRPLPIGHGQTISQPFIVGYMTEIIRPGPGKKILEIGTGSGYQAAVLAATGAQVYTIEIIPQLAASAAARLRQLGYPNLKTKTADGYYGWTEHAPFDAIIVTAAAEFVPPPLIEQLSDVGLMVIPVGSPYFVQRLLLIERRGDTSSSTNLMPVRFVPFRRAE
jgi:protein-L-isoaspartate(D-aspartate) O-methyltransferase